ncbi:MULTISPECIES: DUF3236 domain-containing protein [Methanoregula]|uniref:Uncharacterized protein n=1 Tax=Methanoregula formicica (strain DSM 22288 / NBRC 105244 / SMSP) TaxID=593750 RepID=L0HD08_METFS|nr:MULTISPECIES: DUF3236 domain-containing protein [Methanoregula]AGB01915.1 hypothetical protein Metfor_0859 [Methanoregula formicica SMSP]MDD5143604.1 DUF3236 domain-containing protein [Methanoregula sp.]
MEDLIRGAYHESLAGARKGDTDAELEAIRHYIRGARTIIVPNRNTVKISVINTVLAEFGLPRAVHLHCDTNCCDISRMPALTKALMALDISGCDLVIARGRLGMPGSGSMLVILDNRGRILTAGLSPSHSIHKKPVELAVHDEMVMALERIGLTSQLERQDP